jgi:AraC-like DNA-binding protein/mannose-6-phosphate isomerase-like protein (cupin superfamily)
MVKGQRKKDGFQGQKAVIIPRSVLNTKCTTHPLIRKLYITDMGYYPKARYHYRERLHGTDQHILIYCHEGEGSVTIDKQEYKISPGDFYLIPALTKHTYAANADNPWTIFWIHFKGESADDWVKQIYQYLNSYCGFIPDSEKTIRLFNEIYTPLERGYSMEHLMYSNMYLWHYLSTFIYQEKNKSRMNNAETDTIDSAIDYMQKNVNQNLTLEKIAQHVQFSPSHFSLLFRTKTGFSPIEYYNHLKMQQACQYLLFTKQRIKEIALEIGMSDQHYFSRIFKKTMGASPQEYRNKRSSEVGTS